ncbi:MAG: type II toxin-antitoxin system VapC family toxin [Euryarchaeota archaeon]|nr:type II toxin-antitoxin system VapC family toxin [Euryarchaeota archaeon]
MRFIDASVFVYAYLRPRRALPEDIATFKSSAKKIIERVENGEEVATTVVHLSEIANILEARMPLEQSLEVLSSIVLLNNITIEDVLGTGYIAAIEEALNFGVGVNDVIAARIMKKLRITEIYSFDKHFDKIPDIKRLVD